MNFASHPSLLAGVAATLSWQPLGSDGENATVDPGTVTVGVTASDGTVVVADGTSTGGSGVAARTIALTAANLAQVDALTLTWKVGSTTVATTHADVVGGFYFNVADVRASEPTLDDPTLFPSDRIIAQRDQVEAFFERIQSVAWVPRFATYRKTGLVEGWTVTTPFRFLRAVRWCRVWTSQTGYQALSAAECAAIPHTDSGIIQLPWYVCTRFGVELGVEHGADAPPFDVKDAAMRYCRRLLHKSLTPDRLQPVLTPDGDYVLPPRTGTRWRPTGIEDVDEVLLNGRYNFTLPGGGVA